ncbi:MAG: ATPase domain-containing protein [Nitrososphaerales archaeon]
MSEDRVPTGIDGLDAVILGGFPKNSLILIAGNPGVGKTIFSAKFIYHGIVDHNENGIYVNFVENREMFYNIMKSFGFNFEKLEKERKFRYLEMSTVKEENINYILSTIMEEVIKSKAKRLVIDSFSAMARPFEKSIDVGVVLQMILNRIIRQTGCTTLMVIEVPFGEKKLGLGMEEFLADGIILLNTSIVNERLFRSMEIVKMRGTRLFERIMTYTLNDGFNVFLSFKVKPIEKPRKFEPLLDQNGKFSTGSQDLDYLLGGGLTKGSTMLLEVDEKVSTLQYQLILAPFAWNFAAKGRGVIIIPSIGVDYNIIKARVIEAGFEEDVINSLLRICLSKISSILKEPYPYTVIFQGKNADEDLQKYLSIEEELINKTGQPVLHIAGLDSLISYYGKETAIKMINTVASRIREREGLGILLIKPGYREISKIFGAIADIHLKVTIEHGALILYGIKPRTCLYIVEMDVSKGYPLPKLTPII